MEQYNNPFNVIGIGNPMPPKKPCMTGADFADDSNRGSGDLFVRTGEHPSAYWSDEWKQKREETLKQQRKDKNKVYGYLEERPMLVFVDEPIPDENIKFSKEDLKF
ncbi:MAG: hypothetical protein [Wendovervirus sonii]|uniref:Uncharacterized protein n=1 Tax=phage Lak_Megaphage_Sonny TaxID=3109229 RepID=A0ABZ0Z384_9CAUD|nr:MAG: hypothetical protein [phage Lak_Megaphage_Sonny]